MKTLQKHTERSFSLQDELILINQRIHEQEALFDLADDDNLIEAIIYEQKALHSRYAYLIKQAKEQSLNLSFIERKVLEEC
jgi:hypothetical protein